MRNPFGGSQMIYCRLFSAVFRGRSRVWTAFLLCVLGLFPAGCPAAGADISPPTFIAHAGGGLENHTYTNSLEALDFNYGKGFRFFEVDFSWTSDGELVAIHDWQGDLERRFRLPEEQRIPTRNEFLNLEPTNGLTQLTLAGVLEWAREKGDVFIVTDIKEKNIQALEKIFRKKREFVQCLIPQVYSYAEYKDVKKIGYENIILTLYRMRVFPPFLVYFCGREKPFAVTMPLSLARSGLAESLKTKNVYVYAHTINDLNLFTELRKKGVDGIYTDYILLPGGMLGIASGPSSERNLPAAP
jgi:glycerophosphoryl diester phosphodiesterase